MPLFPLLSQNELTVVKRTIYLPRLPAGFEGFRLIHISDLHFYEHTDPAYYERVVSEVNWLDGDLLAVTGDIIHYGEDYIPMAASYLERLNARHGKYASIGNHDYFDNHGSERIEGMLRRCGYRVLRNDSECLTLPGNDRLWLTGLDDIKYGSPDIARALKSVPSQHEATLMLIHNPLLFDPVAYFPEHQVDLLLAGHTHGGHFYVPIFESVYKALFRMKYRYGMYQKKQSQLHLTSGVGSPGFYYFGEKFSAATPRFRHNTLPEIAVLTLTAWPLPD